MKMNRRSYCINIYD